MSKKISTPFNKLLSSLLCARFSKKQIVLKSPRSPRNSSLTQLLNNHEFVLQEAVRTDETSKARQRKNYLRFLMRLH
jgi:hypothetical protein